MGSANWSKTAIEDNYEATYFEDSPQDTLTFKEYIDNISIQEKDIFLPQTEGVDISRDFLLSSKSEDSGLASNWPKGHGLASHSQSHKSGRRLFKAQAFKQFDLYLLLCKHQQETGKSSFGINYDFLAKKMGYEAPKNLGKYRNEHHYFYG